MGFDHFLKVDLETGDRARQALEEFGQWVDGRYGSDSYDWSGLSHQLFWRWDDPLIQPWAAKEAIGGLPPGTVWVTDVLTGNPDFICQFNPANHPDPGGGLLAWFEIAWLRAIPQDVLAKFYQVMEQHDVLFVWASILMRGERMDDLVVGVMERLGEKGGVEYRKDGPLPGTFSVVHHQDGSRPRQQIHIPEAAPSTTTSGLRPRSRRRGCT